MSTILITPQACLTGIGAAQRYPKEMIVRCGKSYSSPHLSVDFRPGERLNGTEDLPLFPYVRGMGDRLLRIFEEHPGRFVSSEEINRRMGVSRDAVWI